MECDCGGVFEEGKSCYRTRGDNFTLILDDVPAFRCTRCGKILFSEQTVDKVQRMVARLARDSKEIATGVPSVNLYDYR